MKAHIARALAAGYPANKLHELPLFVGLKEGRAYGKPDIERLDFVHQDHNETGEPVGQPYAKPIRHSNFYNKYWRAATRAAGVPDSVRFYDLRHAGISLHVNRLGKDDALSLPEIQERAGHASKVMTFDRYSHAPKRDTDRIRRALSAARPPHRRVGGICESSETARLVSDLHEVVIVAESADHLLGPFGAQPLRRFTPASPAARTTAPHAWPVKVGKVPQNLHRTIPALQSGGSLTAEVGNSALCAPRVLVSSVDLLAYQCLVILCALQLQLRSGMSPAGRADLIPFRLTNSVGQSLV